MSEEYIAKQIEYPEKWDTMAYPTLADALWESLSWERSKIDVLFDKFDKYACIKDDKWYKELKEQFKG